MTDHRGLQRTLFRMQLDPSFARELLRGDADAKTSTGLKEADLQLLAQVDAAALAADPGGKRRLQVLANAASEFTLTLYGAARAGERDLLEPFASAPEMHAALSQGGRLPLAFGSYAVRRARETEASWLAVAELEAAMTALRREARPKAPALEPGAVRLAAHCSLVELAGGTLAFAARLRAGIDADRAPEEGLPGGDGADQPGSGTETVLLVRRANPNPHALADVVAEALVPPADALLRSAANTLSAVDQAAFARTHDATAEDLASFLDSWVADGVLEQGR